MTTNINQLKNSSVRPRLGLVAAFLAIGLLMAASSARADLFYLTSDHCTGGCGPQTPGFGTVELTQDGSNVLVTVSLLNGNKFVETGSGAGMNFLFDNANIALTDITNILSGTGETMAATGSNPGTLHADGTGTWMWGIYATNVGPGGSGAFTGPISFTVLGTTLAEMEVGHAVTGFGTELFVADIISGTSFNEDGSGRTGPVDVNTPPVSTPDAGSTAQLLGLGLLGLGFVAQRRKKA